MADPVGITGTAIGVVSFGLQLYTGISQYLGAVKGREEDLQRAKQYANAFQASLKVLGDTILKVGDEQAAVKSVVQDCKLFCGAELTALGELLNDLKGPQPPQHDPIGKVKGSLQKWSYPFKQRNLSRLEERLESANSILKLSLSALQLAILGNQEKAMLDFQKSVNIIQTTTGSISKATSQQVKELKLMNDTLAQSHEETKNISQRVSAPFDPRIDEILTHLRNVPNAQHQSAQLVAYQQDLKTLCDAVMNLSPRVATRKADHGNSKLNFKTVQSRGNQCCYCARRYDRTRKEVRWGMLFFETELEKTAYHAPECRLSKLLPPTQKKMILIGLSIPRITRILSHALRFSMSLKTGAGGMSLAQNVTWTATINEHSSPAFRIIDSLCALKREPGQGLGAEYHYAVAESCVRRLELCYANHLASPSDTNACGQSILDILAARLCQGRYDTHNVPVDDIAYIFRALAAINVPVAHNPDTKHAYQGSPHIPSRNIKALKEFPQIAENFGFNPLSQAILTEDEETVRFLVKEYPSYMSEVDYCGRSPVHIAIQVGNPSLLAIILEAINPDILNCTDNIQLYPIDYAMFKSSQKQDNDGYRMVELLLESSSVLFQHSLDMGLESHCLRTKTSIIQHLAQRRNSLELLAVSKLSAQEVKELGLCQGYTLDRNAAKVQSYLTARSCNIEKNLMVFEQDELTHASKAPKSIYQYICDRETAEIALSNGFSREHAFIDVFRSIVESVIQGKCYGWPELSYIDWIVDDGVDIASMVPLDLVPGVTPYTTWAHYLMASLGNGLRWSWGTYGALPPKVSPAAFSDAAHDESRCHCCLKGCTPLIRFLEGLGWRTRSFEVLQNLEPRLTKLSDSLQALLPDIGGAYSWVYPAVLRYLTFSALGLRHTCYGLENIGSISILESEEIDEIHDEDSAMLQLLEDLIEDFENRSGSMSSSDWGSFLQDVWAPKIRDTLEEFSRRKLTEEDLRRAEDCGVVWRDYQRENPRMTWRPLPSDLEGWMKRLDDIAIDPQRPLNDALEYSDIKADTGY
ncbi:hypothetical protein FPANT_7352 [Fusarium pseudoanthophilum]|uniref:Fungal N-terminal domain-containing protein n=1 Tax=Fusarium pseudoanthophilum TaxID=48495 RepID=A0A8H5P061_9HYPO|nr:hypothetical protein FPANT_7352 [Fusarium pseudoanthophilum]